MILNELRRGNLILTSEKTGQKPYLRSIVKEIRENGVIVDGDRLCKAEDISGIEITEEWLIKFGFEYIEGAGMNSNIYKKNAFCIDDRYILKYSYIGTKSLLYVHHIQNLFLDLTGEQLKIK